MNRVLFLDIETTGIRTFTDRIIVIGVKELGHDPVTFCTSTCISEARILSNLLNFLEATRPEIICGWKIKKFDLPFIRARALINGIDKLLRVLTKSKILDLAELLSKYCMIDGELPKSSEVIEAFEIDREDVISGSDVPSLYKAGKFDLIVEHNKLDLIITEQLYNKLIPLIKVSQLAEDS